LRIIDVLQAAKQLRDIGAKIKPNRGMGCYTDRRDKAALRAFLAAPPIDVAEIE